MNPDISQEVLNKLLSAHLVEQRRARRWKIFFRGIYVAIILMILVTVMRNGRGAEAASNDHVGIVKVHGYIGAESNASYKNIGAALRNAFDAPGLKGVILDINSPGGSPVQAHLIYEEILRLKAANENIPVYAAIEDVGASGAYYIAAAADEIVASPASVVGSIGVVSMQVGFVDAMAKLGIESRVMTAGENKSMMNPLEPATPDDKKHMQALLDDIHLQFQQAVRFGRGDRLKENADTFSGLIWTGTQALEFGLVDSLGSKDEIVRSRFELKDQRVYGSSNDWFERAFEQFPTKVLDSISQPMIKLL